MTAEIRPLTGADAGELVRLRREALEDAPFAFLASPSDDMAAREETVRAQLQRAPESIVFGAVCPGLVGMVGVYRAAQRKAAHKGMVWGMFVQPQWRRQRVGESLMRAAIGHARALGGIRSLQLSVSEAAPEAKHLYERLGFSVWGVEPEAMQVAGRFVADYHMILRLT